MGSTQGDVFGRAHIAIGIGPDFTGFRDQHDPVKIRFGAVIDHHMGKSFALGGVHRNGWVELNHGWPPAAIDKVQPSL